MKSRAVCFLGYLVLVACTYEKPKDGNLQIEVCVTADSAGCGGVGGGGTSVAGSGGTTISIDPPKPGTGGMGGTGSGYDAGTVVSYGIAKQPGRFYADGVSLRTVRISFVGGVTAGKPLTVTTSLGIINPAAEAAGQRTLALKTTNGSSIEFPLYAQRIPGPGRVTVEGPGGTQNYGNFYLDPLTEQLSIGRSAGYYIADGKQTITLSIGLRSPDESFRKVTVKTTHGTLSPEKKDELARARDIQVSPNNATELEWQLGNVAGTAVVTAEFGDVFAPPEIVVIAPPGAPEQATLTVTPNAGTAGTGGMTDVVADGTTTVPIDITYNASDDRSDTVTLTTTLGVLNPAGTSPEARRATSVSVHGGKTSKVILTVEQTPGVAVITAHAASTSDVAETVYLKAAPPELLTLAALDGTVFDTARRALDVSIHVARLPGNGRVSRGTSLELLACCLHDKNDNTEQTVAECTDWVSAPSFLSDDDGDGRETATVTLTPKGKVFVDRVASQAIEQKAVTLYAYIRAPGAESSPNCETIGGLALSDHLELALEQKPPPPAAD